MLATRIRGVQIKDSDITVTQLANNAVETAKIKDANVTLAKIEHGSEGQVAIIGADGILHYQSVSGDVSINAAGAVTIANDAVVADYINDDVATGLAGVGLSASGGVMALDFNELGSDAINLSTDSVPFINASNESKKILWATISAALAGSGIRVNDTSKALEVSLSELSDVAIDVASDSIAFVDANDSNTSRKESIADLVTAIAGSGLTATNGVLSVDSVASAVVEGDIAIEDESANCTGSETNFTLSNTPVANSLDVFLNGIRQREGSGNDFTLSGTTISFATAPASDDSLIVRYIIDN